MSIQLALSLPRVQMKIVSNYYNYYHLRKSRGVATTPQISKMIRFAKIVKLWSPEALNYCYKAMLDGCGSPGDYLQTRDTISKFRRKYLRWRFFLVRLWLQAAVFIWVFPLSPFPLRDFWEKSLHRPPQGVEPLNDLEVFSL